MSALYLFSRSKDNQRDHPLLSPKHFRGMSIFLFCTWFMIVASFAAASAQETAIQITGTVVDGKTKQPLAGASVYLNQTMRATISADDGKFELKNVPSGNYKLIISYVGYHPVAVAINEGSVNRYTVELLEAEKMLDEVAITAIPNWEEYFLLFKMFFIAKEERQYKIINPRVLYFTHNDSTYTLMARAMKPLIIDNYELGYRVYYDLTSFMHYAGRTSYSGHTHFEEMTASDMKEEKKWKTNRQKAYNGSSGHFMHALVTRKLKEEGFVVRKLVKTDTASIHVPVNKRWEGEEFKSTDTIITMRWNGLDYSPKDTAFVSGNDRGRLLNARYNVLYPEDVPYENMIAPVPATGGHKLLFMNSLFVTYKNKKIREDYWGYGNAYKPSFITSILTMLVPETSIDIHGNLEDPLGVLYEGYWARLRVADQLPFDYKPDEAQP